MAICTSGLFGSAELVVSVGLPSLQIHFGIRIVMTPIDRSLIIRNHRACPYRKKTVNSNKKMPAWIAKAGIKKLGDFT